MSLNVVFLQYAWMFWLLQQKIDSTFFHQQRFIQYLASRNTLFNLNNYLDKSAMQGKNL